MSLTKLVTGIDDIGTGTGETQGWTFISFNELFLPEFKLKSQTILDESGLKSFHGKEFKRKKAKYYVDFFRLIRETLEKGVDGSSFLCCTLNDEIWKVDFKNFCSQIIESEFKSAGITDKKILDGTKKIIAPFYTYQRKASQKIDSSITLIEIDKDSIINVINEENILIKGHELSAKLPIYAALTANRNVNFPSSPEIVDIAILDDTDSFLIQAADLFGNFSLSVANKELGKQSKINDLKDQIFREIFADILDTTAIHSSLELKNDEIILKNKGAFNLCLS